MTPTSDIAQCLAEFASGECPYADAIAWLDWGIQRREHDAETRRLYSEAKASIRRPCEACGDSGRVDEWRGPFTRWHPCECDLGCGEVSRWD